MHYRSIVLAWRKPFFFGVIGLVLGLVLSFALPLRYGSTVRVLIIQPNATGLDPYTAIKSTERIAASLSELIYTTTFFDNVLAQAKDVNAGYFSTDDYTRRKEWKRSIETSIVAGTGIMEVTAYHPSRAQARAIVDAAARELALQAPNYFGYNVRVQVIDSPLDSRWFARPNFIENAVIGGGIGFVLGILWLFFSLGRHRFEWD